MFRAFQSYFQLMRLNKPIGILLLLWPTLWALWLASNGHPQWSVMCIFIAGVILMRSAGCIINDFADRHFDFHVKRTSQRPLATGVIKVRNALVLFVILSLIAFSLVLTLNLLTIMLAVIGAALAITYPFLKRVTHLPQVGLGFAFSWGIPMAFAAEKNAIPYAAWILYLSAMLWPIIYDTMYAMTDRVDDLKIGVKSTAILFAKYDRLIVGFLQIVFLLALSYTGFIFQLNGFFFLSLSMVAGFFCYQQWLIRSRNEAACFQAFLNNHWVGLIVFIGILLGLPT